MPLPQKENLIAAHLEQQIRSGALKKGEKIPSEYELAENFNVSKLTANKAVGRLVERGLLIRQRGRGGTVVADTNGRFKGTIVYFLPLLSGGLFSSLMLRGASACALSHGYGLQYYDIGNHKMDYWSDISGLRPSGVLASCSTLPPADFPYPVIAVNSAYFPNTVTSDDYMGGALVAKLFISSGHRKVAVLSDNLYEDHPRRISGFLDTWKASFPDCDTAKMSVSTVSDYNPEGIWSKIQQAIPGATGVFCYSDTVAFRLLFYLQSRGISCPGDFSVCGYGFMPMIQSISPLTSVNQYPEDMGYQACEKLIEIIEGRSPSTGQIKIPVALMNVNASMGSPKEQGN